MFLKGACEPDVQKEENPHILKEKGKVMNPYFESEYGESRMMHSCPGLIHVVKEGDTLYKISQYHHVSVTDILLANPYVNVYNLQIGDELCIPVGKKIMRDES